MLAREIAIATCPSVPPSVRPSVCQFVRPSVHHSSNDVLCMRPTCAGGSLISFDMLSTIKICFEASCAGMHDELEIYFLWNEVGVSVPLLCSIVFIICIGNNFSVHSSALKPLFVANKGTNVTTGVILRPFWVT